MNDFTGDKVHFEPVSEPSEGHYVWDGVDQKYKGPGLDPASVDRSVNEDDLNIAYAQGRQSMQAEVEELKRKDRVTLEEYGRRCDEITKLQAEVEANAKKAKAYDATIEFLKSEHDLPPDERLTDSPLAMIDKMSELEAKP